MYNNNYVITSDDQIHVKDNETKDLINSLEIQSRKKYIIAALIVHHKNVQLRFGNRYGILATLLNCYDKDSVKLIMDEVYRYCLYI